MSDNLQTLDDIFNSNGGTVVEPETVEAQAETVEETTIEEPEATVETAEADADAPTASKEPESENWTKSAVLDERRKRQELERRLAAMESEKAAKPEEVPDVFEDQNAYNKYIDNKVNQALLNERVNTSEFYARREYPDLDEKVAIFQELAAKDPALQQKVLAARSPYHELVDVVNKHEKLQRMENIDEYEAKIRADVEAKVRAEYEGKLESKQAQDAKVAQIKPSLANARSTASPEEFVEKTLDDVFGR